MGKLVDLEEVVIGSKLEEDVVNAQGLTLLKKGLAIEEKHLKILKRWGVNKILVGEVSAAEEDGRDPKEIIKEKTKAIEEELDLRFSKVLDDPIMKKLKEIVSKYRIKTVHDQYDLDDS